MTKLAWRVGSRAGSGRLLGGATAVVALLLAACGAVELENTKPAQEVARMTAPPGSVYTGWRVFQDRCATCHGAAATGTARAPDLLPRVREMGVRRFVGLVLNRYDWTLPPEQARRDGPQREALIEAMVQRKAGALTMPAWQGEPSVQAHIVDLYAYLSARADGRQGSDKPSR